MPTDSSSLPPAPDLTTNTDDVDMKQITTAVEEIKINNYEPSSSNDSGIIIKVSKG